MLDVQPASAAMQVVLLIDDSGPGIREIREGVASFMRIVQRSAEIAIVTTAKQNTGGRTEQVGQASGIPTRLSEIAYELRDQLVVTYARPQSAKPVEKIEIAVSAEA